MDNRSAIERESSWMGRIICAWLDERDLEEFITMMHAAHIVTYGDVSKEYELLRDVYRAKQNDGDRKMKRDVTVNIELTPEEWAEEFALMGSDDQAKVFNHLAIIFDGWFVEQLQRITDSPVLTTEGRDAMDKIGEYSK